MHLYPVVDLFWSARSYDRPGDADLGDCSGEGTIRLLVRLASSMRFSMTTAWWADLRSPAPAGARLVVAGRWQVPSASTCGQLSANAALSFQGPTRIGRAGWHLGRAPVVTAATCLRRA